MQNTSRICRRGAIARLLIWSRHHLRWFGFIYHDPSQDGLKYWRERILFAVLAAGCGLALVALLPAVYMAIRESHVLLLIADLLASALMGWLLFSHRIRLRVRSTAVLLITFFLGVLIISKMGYMSGGPAWLFCFAVLASVLLGLKAAVVALCLNTAALFGLAGLAGIEIPISSSRAVTAGANFVFLNAVSAISVAVLVNGLQTLNTKARSAAAALEKERAALLKIKEALAQEIGERVKSEQALAQSERSYRLLADNVRDIIWTMDMNLRFTYVSPAVHSLLAWDQSEFLSLKLENVMTPDSLAKSLAVFDQECRIGKEIGSFERSVILEMELYRKDGTTIWTEVTASFLLEENGLPLGILGVTRDITDRLRTIQEKEELLERLNRSRKMEALGTLAGGVAHDLNNVLSGIVSYPDLLLMELPQDSPLRKPMETIQESGKKAAAIVQDLLTLARRGVAVPEVVNLNALVEAYLRSPEFERLWSFHPLVEVESSLDPTLLNVMGSPIHLSKTIMNLVSNAAESMSNGGKLTITTQNRYVDKPLEKYPEVKEGDYVLLKVSDTGIGIAPEDLHRIFEPFYTKKKMGRSGTGLGMAVVWGTVQDHHGHIDIQSVEGKGTTAALYFPATREEVSAAKERGPIEACRGNNETILIVDDVKEQRDIATRIVEQLGYVAKSVASGEAAVEFMRNGRADLVVLDMILDSDMDGLETYRHILKYHPHQKAIITSGFAETGRVKSAQKLGAGEYVRKPYMVGAIGTAIKAELSKVA